MSTLILEKLNLIYSGSTHAVKDVDLAVADGEFCVFLGPSGCGKTSTLRMIAGLETPTSGEVRLDGRAITRLYPGERDIAMVFQSYALYPHLTVRDHFAFPLRAQKVPKADRRRRIEETAALLHMTDLLDARPRQLSGGQAQRTAIGRALIRQPKLFLLDEPLTSLDAQLRLETRIALKRLQTDLRITTIYVTHDQEEALSLADRIVIMHDGRVQQVADSRELYRNPANRFVAGFVGTPAMNFIPATVRAGANGGADGLVLDTEAFRLPLPPELLGEARGLVPGRSVTLGVRPEDLAIGVPPTEAETPRGRVLVVEPQGDERIVSVAVGPTPNGSANGHPGGAAPAGADPVIWKVRAPKRGHAEWLDPGDLVGLTVRPRGLRLFDAATEERVV